MNILQLISIFLEVIVAAIGVMLAVSKKKRYGWFITLTVVIYVFYDLANLLFSEYLSGFALHHFSNSYSVNPLGNVENISGKLRPETRILFIKG